MHLSSRISLYVVVFVMVWGLSAGRLLTDRLGSRTPKKAMYKTIVYMYGLTLAEVKREPFNGTMVYCKLSELKSGDECEQITATLTVPVRHLCAKKMMNLIIECMNMANEDEVANAKNVGDDTGFFSGLASGIYPGTKWCGSGHKAMNYFDLGSKVKLDKCCRAHDHCPIKVEPWSAGYGETNWSFYTKSHCDCDTDFYNCLVAADSAAADTVGSLYFNTMKVPCLREAPGESLCPERKPGQRCPSAHLQRDLVLTPVEPEYIFHEKNRTKPREDHAQPSKGRFFFWR